MEREGLGEFRIALHGQLCRCGLSWFKHRTSDEMERELEFFLGGGVPVRDHLIAICGGFRISSQETNRILRLAGYEELKEGEAADGTKIADLEKRIVALEKAGRGLSRAEVEARYPHGLGLAP